MAFIGIFQNFQNNHSVTCEQFSSLISLYLHKYLHIFPIHFHLTRFWLGGGGKKKKREKREEQEKTEKT